MARHDPVLWLLTAAWLVLPLLLGPALGGALDGPPERGPLGRADRCSGWRGSSGSWPCSCRRSPSLTAVRLLAPLGVVAAVVAALTGADAWPTALAVAGTLAVAVLCLHGRGRDRLRPGLGLRRRAALPAAPPRPPLLGPDPSRLAWGSMTGALVAGPLLLAAGSWVAGAALTVVGAALVRPGRPSAPPPDPALGRARAGRVRRARPARCWPTPRMFREARARRTRPRAGRHRRRSTSTAAHRGQRASRCGCARPGRRSPPPARWSSARAAAVEVGSLPRGPEPPGPPAGRRRRARLPRPVAVTPAQAATPPPSTRRRPGRRARRSGRARPAAAASAHVSEHRRASIARRRRGWPWALHCASTSPDDRAVGPRRASIERHRVDEQVGAATRPSPSPRHGRRRRRSGGSPPPTPPRPRRWPIVTSSTASTVTRPRDPSVSTHRRRAAAGCGRPGTPARPPVDVMKHTSWLSGLAAVRSPSAAARARTSALVSPPTGKRTRPARPGRACGARSSGPWPGRHRGATRRAPCAPSTTRAWWPVATASKPEQAGPPQQAIELEVAVALDARVRRAARPRGRRRRARPRGASKSSPKLNTRWSMPSCWATRRASSTSADRAAARVAVAAPQLHRDADHVVARRRRSSAAATDESTPPLMATSTGRSVMACPTVPSAPQLGHGGRDHLEGAVDVGVGRRRSRARAAARQRRPPWARPSRPARARAPWRRSRTTMPPTRRRRRDRAGTAAPRSRPRRCTRAPSRRPWRSAGTVSMSARNGRRRARPTSRSRERADALDHRGPISRGDPQRLGHGRRSRPRCACRCAGRAPARRRAAAARV